VILPWTSHNCVKAQQGSCGGGTAPRASLQTGLHRGRAPRPAGEVRPRLREPEQPSPSHVGNGLLGVQYCLHICQNWHVYYRVSLLIARTGASPAAVRNIVYEIEIWSNRVTHSYFKATSHKAILLKPRSPKPNTWSLALGSRPESSGDGLSRVKPGAAASLAPRALRTDMQ